MNKSAIVDVLDYVIQTEGDDFYEQPSENHVYFKAYEAKYGYPAAKKMLKDALTAGPSEVLDDSNHI